MSSTAATRPKASAKRGTLYLGGTGMLTWLLHRISGIAVVYFLTLHIYEALQLFGGPAAYNEATLAYKQPWFRPFEVALILAVTYHALNGLRVSMFDLFPNTTKYHRRIFMIGVVIFVLVALAISLVMLRRCCHATTSFGWGARHLDLRAGDRVPVGLPVSPARIGAGDWPDDRLAIQQPPGTSGDQPVRARDVVVHAHLRLRDDHSSLHTHHADALHQRHRADHRAVCVRSVCGVPAWAWIDLAILFFAWLHGLNGLRVVLTDYIGAAPGANRVVMRLSGSLVCAGRVGVFYAAEFDDYTQPGGGHSSGV
jgi:succinate dehydrogenase / fumarate reductase cytochrome b subunit